jgi:uncharacterized membrane protein
MQALVDTFKTWQLHAVVDHYTVALIVVGILVDLFAGLMPSRSWPRTTALTLMVAGTAAAWGSQLTGGWEAGRVWKSVEGGPAIDILKRHAELGDWLPWVFLALALWRIGIQFLGFLASSRSIYLLIAIIAGGVIIYQGHLGGELVYDYGVGTALMPAVAPSETPQASPSATPVEPSAIPTVFNPSAVATPEVSPSPEASPMGGVPTEVPTATESPAAVTEPSAVAPEPSPATPEPSPTATPLAPGGTPVMPPAGEASPAASSAATPAPRVL